MEEDEDREDDESWDEQQPRAALHVFCHFQQVPHRPGEYYDGRDDEPHEQQPIVATDDFHWILEL